jgi:hypothetical protein
LGELNSIISYRSELLQLNMVAFGESLSFAAQKKVTKEKGTLPLLLRKRKEASAQRSLLLVA